MVEQQEVTDGVSTETLACFGGRSPGGEGYREEGRHGGHSLWQGPKNGEATLGADRYMMSGCELARAVTRRLPAEGARGRYSSTELVWCRRTQAHANRAEYTSPKPRACYVCQPLRSAPECEEYGSLKTAVGLARTKVGTEPKSRVQAQVTSPRHLIFKVWYQISGTRQPQQR